jgi:MoxR-like ATPase
MSVREKLLETKRLVKSVFYHEEYYIDSVLSAFASRAHICLLGFRGSGKTHLMETIIKMVEPNITSVVQGYLSAEIEDVFARPDIASLMKGEEKVVWKRAVKARIKGFDEIQRLGVGALSSMFRLMTKGTVQYLDQEEGVKEFWVIATANPTETGEDTLNIRLPEPLWDRFDCVIWIPVAPLKYQLRINSDVEKAKEELPIVWTERDLLELWKEVEKVKIEEREAYIITLINRLLGFCQFAQGFDASSLTEAQKRSLCSKCNRAYICAKIARPPSVRAKLSLARLARGFAYLRGRDKIELQDIIDAFPLVYWNRIKFMDESQIANRLQKLKELVQDIIVELKEVREALALIEELKEEYSTEKYEILKNWVNAKGWLVELKEDLDDYYSDIANQLAEKFKDADAITKFKIYTYAKAKLPPQLAKQFEVDSKITVELTPENIALLAKVDMELFRKAKALYERGERSMTIEGEDAYRYLMLQTTKQSSRRREGAGK